MYTEFSFSRLMRHLTEGADLPRATNLPTEAHMREALEGYVTNIAIQAQEYSDKYFTFPRVGEDPVGTKPLYITGESHVLDEMASIIDVPFVPQKAELTGPVTFSFGNEAAMPFRLWAQIDGRNVTIDIIEIMTFDENGKINKQMAYWGADNVTLLD